MSERKNQNRKDQDYAFGPVPKSARRSFRSMFFILLGFTFFSASMSVGARLGNSLDLSGFVLSVVFGGLFLACYAGMLAYIGSSTGLSFDLLARKAFGRKGSYLPSFMIALTQIGWFGVGLAMFAFPAAETLNMPVLPLILLAGICMTGSAYFGIRGMEIVSVISVPMITVLGMYSMFRAIGDAGGINEVFAGSRGGMSLLTGIGLVIGSFISGGTATPNFTRFADTNKAAVVSGVIAFFLGNSLMFIFGAVGGAYTGKDDIFYVMKAQGLIVPALIVLGANVWTTNDNGLYNGGLALSNLTGYNKKPLVIAAGILGTAASVWLYENFVSWLIILNASLPPVGAILILDFLRHRSVYDRNEDPKDEIRWGAAAGVILGMLAGTLIPWGIGGVNAMIIAVLGDELVTKMTSKRNR